MPALLGDYAFAGGKMSLSARQQQLTEGFVTVFVDDGVDVYVRVHPKISFEEHVWSESDHRRCTFQSHGHLVNVMF